jgi:hypothetical protein
MSMLHAAPVSVRVRAASPTGPRSGACSPLRRAALSTSASQFVRLISAKDIAAPNASAIVRPVQRPCRPACIGPNVKKRPIGMPMTLE